MVITIPVRRFDDRAMMLSLLSSLKHQGYSLSNIESKLVQIAPVDKALLRTCLDEVGVDQAVATVPHPDKTRQRIARYVR